jgi:hypothetical protein
MKRWIALAVGALAVVVYAAVPVAAASGAPAAGPTVAAKAASSPVTSPPVAPSGALDVAFTEQPGGSGLSVTLDAGATEQHDLVVANHTPDLRLTVKLTASDATGSITAGTSSWIAFGTDVVEIDPNSAQTIPVTISVPHDTQPGEALAHVVATITSAALAADGSPRSVSLSKTLPISIAVNGSPTAQVAITDVHRIDSGSTHQLAIVMRNFGDQGARVSGQVRVGGSIPQTLQFGAELAPRRDTTLLVGWDAPPKNVAADIDVEANYGSGDTASWSSEVGGPPTTIATQPPSDAYTTPTSVGDGNSATTPTTSTSSSGPAPKPWWQRDAIPLGVIGAILLAVLWFTFELVSSRRRRRRGPAGGQPFIVMPTGWAQAGTLADPDGSVDLARQLLALSQAIVRLASGLPAMDNTQSPSQPQPQAPVYDTPDRVRSPAADPPPAAAAPGAHVDDEEPSARTTALADEPAAVDVRSVPTPPHPADPAREKQRRRPRFKRRKVTRVAPPTPRVESRPEVEPTPPSTPTETPTPPPVPKPDPPRPAPALPPPPAPTPPKAQTPELVKRLLALDKERRQLKDWMDVTDEGALAWPTDEEVRRFTNQRDDRTRDS